MRVYAPPPRIKTGTYTGDGNPWQTISGLGFKPKYVRVSFRAVVQQSVFIGERWDAMTSGLGLRHEEAAVGHKYVTTGITSFHDDGFVVGTTFNTLDLVYCYVAFG